MIDFEQFVEHTPYLKNKIINRENGVFYSFDIKITLHPNFVDFEVQPRLVMSFQYKQDLLYSLMIVHNSKNIIFIYFDNKIVNDDNHHNFEYDELYDDTFIFNMNLIFNSEIIDVLMLLKDNIKYYESEFKVRS